MHGSAAFTKFSKVASRVTGHALSFIAALLVIAVWALAGPLFHFSDTWQLTINTATTIITFLMVFVIQNSQTRDLEAMQIKLDEVVRVTKAASNRLLDLEELPEEELHAIQERYEQLARKARRQKREGKKPAAHAKDVKH